MISAENDKPYDFYTKPNDEVQGQIRLENDMPFENLLSVNGKLLRSKGFEPKGKEGCASSTLKGKSLSEFHDSENSLENLTSSRLIDECKDDVAKRRHSEEVESGNSRATKKVGLGTTRLGRSGVAIDGEKK